MNMAPGLRGNSQHLGPIGLHIGDTPSLSRIHGESGFRKQPGAEILEEGGEGPGQHEERIGVSGSEPRL